MLTWEHFPREGSLFFPCDTMSMLYVTVCGRTNIFIIIVDFETGSVFEPGLNVNWTYQHIQAHSVQASPTRLNMNWCSVWCLQIL